MPCMSVPCMSVHDACRACEGEMYDGHSQSKICTRKDSTCGDVTGPWVHQVYELHALGKARRALCHRTEEWTDKDTKTTLARSHPSTVGKQGPDTLLGKRRLLS